MSRPRPGKAWLNKFVTPGVPMADEPKAPPRAFSGNDLYRLLGAIEALAETQLGVLMDPFTGDELKELFVPRQYREALCTVYDLQDTANACGEIWLDLASVRNKVDTTRAIYDDRNATIGIQKAALRIYFHRDFMPNGFVTPKPLFGMREQPRQQLQLAGEVLEGRFCRQAEQLLYTAIEWAMVKWTMQKLQTSIRTPPQVRYIWPAIQTLAKVAKLEMDLTAPSARAGMNARPDPAVAPYLRGTNDTVANSVLLGVDETYRDRFKRGDIRVQYATVITSTGEAVSV